MFDPQAFFQQSDNEKCATLRYLISCIIHPNNQESFQLVFPYCSIHTWFSLSKTGLEHAFTNSSQKIQGIWNKIAHLDSARVERFHKEISLKNKKKPSKRAKPAKPAKPAETETETETPSSSSTILPLSELSFELPDNLYWHRWFIPKLIKLLVNYCRSPHPPLNVVYHIISFFTSILSQFVTRRFIIFLFRDSHALEQCIEGIGKDINLVHPVNSDPDSSTIEQFFGLWAFYLKFPINTIDGTHIPLKVFKSQAVENFALFERYIFKSSVSHRIAFQAFSSKTSDSSMEILPGTRGALLDFFESFSSEKLQDLLQEICVHFRLIDSSDTFGVQVLKRIILNHFSPQKVSQLETVSLLPTEQTLWNTTFYRPHDWDGSDSNTSSFKRSSKPSKTSFSQRSKRSNLIPIPTLELQYLDMVDYLIRNFFLLSLEAADGIRTHIEDVLLRIKGRFLPVDNAQHVSKLCDSISATLPFDQWHAEFQKQFSGRVQFKGWSPFCLIPESFSITAIDDPRLGTPIPSKVSGNCIVDIKRCQPKVALKWDETNLHSLLYFVELVPVKWEETWVNEFPQVLQHGPDTLNVEMYKRLGIRRIRCAEVQRVYDVDSNQSMHWYYKQKAIDSTMVKQIGTKRRYEFQLDPVVYYHDQSLDPDVYNRFTLVIRRDEKDNNFFPTLVTIRQMVTLCQHPDTNPFPSWFSQLFLGYTNPKQQIPAPKNIVVPSDINQQIDLLPTTVPFTDVQKNAVYKSIRPGISIILGPPGTGKTDVAVHIINALYNMYPKQRILICTHSNQAINDIFEKIQMLPTIKSHHLVRLGHGASSEQDSLLGESKIEQLSKYKVFDFLVDDQVRGEYLLKTHSRCVFMTVTHAGIKYPTYSRMMTNFDTVLFEEAAQIKDIESVFPLTMGTNLKRIILIGDNFQLEPIVSNSVCKNVGKLSTTLFTRLVQLGVTPIMLNAQGRCRPELSRLFAWRYPEKIIDLDHTSQGIFSVPNPGLEHTMQFINVQGRGESSPLPYYYQNLDEAEQIVTFYRYLLLVGYPNTSITVLTTYNGQVALLHDVFHHHSRLHNKFPLPRISTVDKYQGQQADIILLSLVRSKAIGHLADYRRMTVSFSRARLGLYVFGNWSTFSHSKVIAKNILVHFPKDQGYALRLNEIWTSDFGSFQRSNILWPFPNQFGDSKSFESLVEQIESAFMSSKSNNADLDLGNHDDDDEQASDNHVNDDDDDEQASGLLNDPKDDQTRNDISPNEEEAE